MTEGRANMHPTSSLETAASLTEATPSGTGAATSHAETAASLTEATPSGTGAATSHAEAAARHAEASPSPTELVAQPVEAFRRDRLTWLAYMTLGYYGYLINGIGPSLPGLRDDLGIGFGLASLHSSLFAVGMVVAGLLGDRVVALLGRRTSFWGAALGMAAATWVLASARALALTLPAALAMGTIGSLLIILIPAILSDGHAVHRSTAFAEANSISSAAGAIAPVVIGATIFAGLGWGPGLALAPTVLLAVLAGVFGSTRFPAPVRTTAARTAGVAHGGASPLGATFWRHWLTLVLVVAVEFCMVFWAADYLRTEVGVAPAAAAASVATFLAGMVVGRVVGGRIALRTTPDRLLVGALALSGAGFVAFWWTGLPVPSVAGLALTGLGVAMLYPLALALAVGAAPGASDRAAARSALGSGVAVGVAPLVLGWTADLVGLRAAYLLVPALLLLAFLAVRTGPRPSVTGPAAPQP